MLINRREKSAVGLGALLCMPTNPNEPKLNTLGRSRTRKILLSVPAAY